MTIKNVPLTLRLDSEVESNEKRLEKLAERLRVASPGIIKSFDAAKQTVTVQITIRERVSLNGSPVEDIAIPILLDVPIYMPRAGNFVLTMPVTEGNECLVIFSDCCFDAWYESGELSNQIDLRRHDLSDGFALIGVWSQPNVISDYSTDSTFLRNLNNDSYVEVRDNDINIYTPTKITIDAGSEVEVNAPTVNVNCDDATVTATVSTTVNAPSVSVNATTVEVTSGTITLTGTSGITLIGSNLSKIDGRNFLNHVHSGVESGTGNTGGVV